MSEAFRNSLKHIDKLSHIEKERVLQWVKRYVEPSSSVDGRLINEMREIRFKEGFECPHCASEHVVRFGKYNGLHSRMKQWIDRFKGVATKYLDNYLAWFLFVDSCSNESTKHNIKEFLLSSFVYEMIDTYESLRLSKFIV
ncbi:hypothetical protein AB1283_02355 [Bacillus sp. S13(2024)]|uniref:hypothetical protein n=1 Tax=unclassified Bacillus (in: firmicutes) TaxID=185979 RepID=UPI003D19D313